MVFKKRNLRAQVPDAEVLQEESVAHTDVRAVVRSKRNSALLLNIAVVECLLEVLERPIFEFDSFLNARLQLHDDPRVVSAWRARSTLAKDSVVACNVAASLDESR